MPHPAPYLPGAPDGALCLPLVALAAAADAVPEYAGSPLRLDCRALPYRRTQGVCHQVSQLLLLRRKGFSISLHRASPVLRHSLHLLRVAHLFTWVA